MDFDVNNLECEDEFCCLDEDVIIACMDDFNYTIRQRGEDYYNSGKVIKCYKSNHEYYAKVKGKCFDYYDVSVKISNGKINLECSCPCNFNCKHEYAVLMALDYHEYEEVVLKPEIKEVKMSLINLIKKIPADEIKEFLLSSKINLENFDRNLFENYFRGYLPKQSYDYYYNKLYNTLVLDRNYKDIVDNYLNIISQYFSSGVFDYGFEIVKSIIEAFKDSNKLNSEEYIIEKMPVIGMMIRVINRRGSDEIRQEISKWTYTLKDNNFYDNVYLEDIILMIN